MEEKCEGLPAENLKLITKQTKESNNENGGRSKGGRGGEGRGGGSVGNDCR